MHYGLAAAVAAEGSRKRLLEPLVMLSYMAQKSL